MTIDANDAWLDAKSKKIKKLKQKHNELFSPPPMEVMQNKLTTEEVHAILHPKKERKAKVNRRRHAMYTFTKAEVDMLIPLVTSYNEMLKKDASVVERNKALGTLISAACAMKQIDPSVEKNSKQMKFQLLSCRCIEPSPTVPTQTKRGIEHLNKGVANQACKNHISPVACQNIHNFETSPAINLIKIAAKKFIHRRRLRPHTDVCSSGTNGRKKGGHSRRYYRSRIAAGPRRSRNVFQSRISRQARQQFRDHHKRLYHSLLSDSINPSAFTNADTRAKHQSLRDMEVFIEKIIGPKFVFSMRNDTGVLPYSSPSCCGHDSCRCLGVSLASTSSPRTGNMVFILLRQFWSVVADLISSPLQLMLIFMLMPVVTGTPTNADHGQINTGVAMAAAAAAAAVGVAVGTSSSSNTVKNPYKKASESSKSGKRVRGPDKVARKKRPKMTEKEKKKKQKEKKEKEKKEAEAQRVVDTKKGNAAMRALFQMMQKGDADDPLVETDPRAASAADGVAATDGGVGAGSANADDEAATGTVDDGGRDADGPSNNNAAAKTEAVLVDEMSYGEVMVGSADSIGGANPDGIALPDELEDNIETFFETIMSDSRVPDIRADLDVEDDGICDLDLDDDVSVDDNIDINPAPTLPHIDNINPAPNPPHDGNVDVPNPLPTKGPSTPTGIQQKFVCFVQRRIQYELSKDFKGLEKQWLLEHLRQNDWVIKSGRAINIAKRLNDWIAKSASSPDMARKLGLPVEKLRVDNPSYYRDVHVWLPDVRWGAVMMPSCPTCKTNKDVGVHGFCDDHYGRLVVGLEENYYIISRRYLCRCCQTEKKKIEESVKTFASQNNVNIDVEKVNFKYTFMGWNMKSLPLFADGRGDNFPAFLTWRAGVDKSLINLMRPLFDSGVRPEKLSDILLELHSKKHTHRHLNHERKLARRRRLDSNAVSDMFSTFGDQELYNGRIPTGRYLSHVYKQYHASIRSHLDNEVKKRGAETLHWDVSYKEAKNLCQYNGKPVFHGLVTALNEFGEVRIQFHVFSDSHDQMRTALTAFEKTRTEYGLPGVNLFLTDDPGRDKNFFPGMLASLQKQQDIFDSQTSTLASSVDPLPEPVYDGKFTKIASSVPAIDNAISAMWATMGDEKIVGLDCEWKVVFRKRSMGGQDKVALLQLSYEDKQGQMRVLILKLYRLGKLPTLLQSFLFDESIRFVGVNVSGDMRKIGRDFGVVEKMNRRVTKNVINLGKFARVRDVVQNGSVGLGKLCRIVLGLSMDKSNSVRFSDWTLEKLTDDQINYAAIDVIVSLQLYMALEKMPDLTRRLELSDICVGKKVDIVPRNGSVACMATRAASGIIVGMEVCESPVGILPKKAKCGEGHVTVKIETVYSSALQLPRYRVEATGARATLDDCGFNNVILPLKMLRDHVESGRVRQTEVTPGGSANDVGRTLPTAASPVDGSLAEANNDVLDCDDDLDAGPGVDDSVVDIYDLTTDDIERIRASFVESIETQSGRAPLQCKGLDDPPNIDEIVDKYCCVIGDVFHAMDRAKVPIKHEAKKGYFVALREAFFIWDEDMMGELRRRMIADGMSEEQIDNAKYFDKGLFTGCISRRVPPPSILYWRVRAVYALYGKMIDSKTRKPLFNTRAWNKANNVLKDILEGYYSDPPGIDFHTKKLSADGSIQKNKYGMEMIECMRGTNRTEAYHKNLLMTFGRWNTGIEMSTCLLSERRHRHNHRCSERRRFGFPRIGHYDTWLIDQLQNLVMENHETRLYPNWSNASDYRMTDESFDTIALHSLELDKALHDQFQSVVKKSDVCLTTDQKYLSESMGVPLPFLPFTTVEERVKFAECVLTPDFPSNDNAASIAWCKYVDGVSIFPKLPVHVRTYREQFQRNERVRQSVENAREGNAKLAELNEALNSVTNGGCVEIAVPKSMPDPKPQAMHQAEFVVVGSVAVGKTKVTKPVIPPRKKDKTKRAARVCRSCCPTDGSRRGKYFQVCTGRTSKGVCAFFKDGLPIPCGRCVDFGGGKEDTCIAWSETTKRRDCNYFNKY